MTYNSPSCHHPTSCNNNFRPMHSFNRVTLLLSLQYMQASKLKRIHSRNYIMKIIIIERSIAKIDFGCVNSHGTVKKNWCLGFNLCTILKLLEKVKNLLRSLNRKCGNEQCPTR